MVAIVSPPTPDMTKASLPPQTAFGDFCEWCASALPEDFEWGSQCPGCQRSIQSIVRVAVVAANQQLQRIHDAEDRLDQIEHNRAFGEW